MSRMDDQGRSARRKWGAIGALMVGPIALLVAAIKILEPHEYPAGDIRNDVWYWIAFGLAVLLVIGTLMVLAIREVVFENRKDH